MDPRQELEKIDCEWIRNSEYHRSTARREVWSMIGGAALAAGFGLAMFGRWLDDLGEDVQLERMLHPWPVVIMWLGVGFVCTSLVYIIPNGRHINAYRCAKMQYELRRDELLQIIHCSDSGGGND